MLDLESLATSDPLGLGGLLIDASRLAQLDTSSELVSALLAAAVMGLRSFVAQPDLRAPARLRLAFRELGLAIGLASLTTLQTEPFARKLDASGQTSLDELEQYLPLRTEIEAFWLLPYHREVPTWIEHADINDVMLATSLQPDGFLSLGSPRVRAPVATTPRTTLRESSRR
jgi:hypothetical protein